MDPIEPIERRPPWSGPPAAEHPERSTRERRERAARERRARQFPRKPPPGGSASGEQDREHPRQDHQHPHIDVRA
jgi:hypothetical protein